MQKFLIPTRALLMLAAALWLLVPRFCQSAEPAHLLLDAKSSSVTFSCESTLHNFHGEAQGFSGSAILDPSAEPPIQEASLSFTTARLTTFEAARDKKMWAWLKVDGHPDAAFHLEKVRLTAGDYKAADAQHPASFAVAGSFTLNGLKKALSGTAKGWREKNRLIVAGNTAIDTLQFGLPQIRELFMTVNTNVKVSYRFSFILPPAFAAKEP